MQPEIEERRKHKRHRVDNSVAVSHDGVFQVSDISKGGFSFKCPPYTPIADFWKTDLLTPVEKLKEYPVKRVWISLTENHTRNILTMAVGVKFGRLTKEQDSLLSQLMDAVSENEDPLH